MNKLLNIHNQVEALEAANSNCIKDMWLVLRPNQWIKNLFVFLGILFSGSWLDSYLLTQVFLTAVAFCLVSSAVYVLNDLLDRENDKMHPTKRFRPIASGKVTQGQARLLFLLCAVLGFSIGVIVSPLILLLLLLYLGQNIAYSKILKKVVIVDVFIIAFGFILRILAGTWGIGIAPSRWMLLCSLMLTLFLGFGKRWAELSESGGEVSSRPVLGQYSIDILNQFTGITAGGVIITYSLYTLDPSTIAMHKTDKLIYTVPFVIYGIFRYLYLVHTGKGGDPSTLVSKDYHIIGAVFLWLSSVIWILR